jgi:catechol 2,3-dioxygenase-like lactoylglutathione lyase family enzyme
MIKAIAHLAICVADMETSKRFYSEALGFAPKFSLKDEQGRPWIEYLEVAKDQFIELFYASERTNDFAHQSFQHVCFEVTDIAAHAKQIVESGWKLVHPVSMGLDYNKQCWTVDPDGNPIELMEYGEMALQRRT